MPFAFRIDPVRRLVITRISGVLISRDAVRWAEAVTADPNFDPRFDHLCSFEAVTDTRLDVPGVHLASTLSPFSEESRRAFIMPSDELYGLGRAFQLLLGTAEVQHRLFRDRASAVAWLALDPSVADVIDRLGGDP